MCRSPRRLAGAPRGRAGPRAVPLPRRPHRGGDSLPRGGPRRRAATTSKLAYALGDGVRADAAAGQGARVDRAHVSLSRPIPRPRTCSPAQMMNRLELEDLAEAELKQAVAKDPRAAGSALPARADRDLPLAPRRGLALMRAELAINPAHAMALYRIGDVYSARRNGPKRSPRCSSRSGSIRTSAVRTSCSGRRTSKTDQPAAAEDMLRRAIQYDPNNKSAHYLLAQILQQAGRPRRPAGSSRSPSACRETSSDGARSRASRRLRS